VEGGKNDERQKEKREKREVNKLCFTPHKQKEREREI
jgi:hypothetical protein